MGDLQLQSILTCPQCQGIAKLTMSTDACLQMYECPHCKAVLRRKDGDCCVFCSYGSVKGPPMQQGIGCNG